MFKDKSGEPRSQRIKTLQRRCDRLTESCAVLKGEKAALENELEICKAKLACVEKAEEEFMKEIEKTKQIRERYEQAYNDLIVIKMRYSAEMNKLIKTMKF